MKGASKGRKEGERQRKRAREIEGRVSESRWKRGRTGDSDSAVIVPGIPLAVLALVARSENSQPANARAPTAVSIEVVDCLRPFVSAEHGALVSFTHRDTAHSLLSSLNLLLTYSMKCQFLWTAFHIFPAPALRPFSPHFLACTAFASHRTFLSLSCILPVQLPLSLFVSSLLFQCSLALFSQIFRLLQKVNARCEVRAVTQVHTQECMRT
eukprot:5987203-Pleurochrysis_carterae.AAC.4